MLHCRCRLSYFRVFELSLGNKVSGMRASLGASGGTSHSGTYLRVHSMECELHVVGEAACHVFGGQPLPGYDGLHPGDWMFGPDQRLRLVELRGDWKYHVQAFRLRSHFTSNALCHACQAAKVATLGPSCIEFTRNPAWLQTIRTQRQFMLQELQDPINGLVFCAGFHYFTVVQYAHRE